MKKRIVSFFLCLTILLSFVYSEDENSYYINDVFHGTYLPVKFIDNFEKTLNFEKAKRAVPKYCHDVFSMQDDGCWSSVGYHDGYKIDNKEFSKYKFDRKGNDLFVTDDKGNKYKRISTRPGLYVETAIYIVNKMFECAKDLRSLDVLGYEILVARKGYYELMLDSNWYSTSDCLALFNGCGLKTNGISGGLYPIVKRGNYMEFDVSDEEIVHFPILSYEPLIPLEEMSISELRLYRNIQFARHGYKFKSPDLTEIFSQFEWYKPKQNNDGIKLTEEEQAIVEKCFALENKKKEILAKNKVVTLSEEEKKQYITGVWYNTKESSNESYGYVFFNDGTFEYKDTVTETAKDRCFISCNGEWKIVNDDIYVTIKNWREINTYDALKDKEYFDTEHPSPAYYKIGNLSSFVSENDKDGKRGELHPLMLCYVQKYKKQPFYFQKDISSNLDNVDFYNIEYVAVEKSGTGFNEYLKNFFGSQEYSVKVNTEYKQPFFIAQSFIDEKNGICDKAVVYSLDEGFIDVLLTFDKGKVSNKEEQLFDEDILNIDGWKLQVNNNLETNTPYIYAVPKAGGESKEGRTFQLEMR